MAFHWWADSSPRWHAGWELLQTVWTQIRADRGLGPDFDTLVVSLKEIFEKKFMLKKVSSKDSDGITYFRDRKNNIIRKNSNLMLTVESPLDVHNELSQLLYYPTRWKNPLA